MGGESPSSFKGAVGKCWYLAKIKTSLKTQPKTSGNWEKEEKSRKKTGPLPRGREKEKKGRKKEAEEWGRPETGREPCRPKRGSLVQHWPRGGQRGREGRERGPEWLLD